MENLQKQGVVLGALAVVAFSLTLPASQYVVSVFSPLFVGLGRAALAGMLAGIMLWWTRSPLPPPVQLRHLIWVVAGVVLGFPVLSTYAMQVVPASHGGVVLGILPLLTALVGAWIGHERPSVIFWLAALVGAVLVVWYALPHGSLFLQSGDALLLLAGLSAAVGYAYGGYLARDITGWQVICWALVLALPLTLPASLWLLPVDWMDIEGKYWLGLLYLALVSQLFGFFLWYRALAIGGITRISQLQLLQPFFTLLVASVWLGEAIEFETLGFASAVVVTVFVGKHYF
ncbi:MAG: DMT family transporter [Candidatus Thiothrix putei]|uniref:DMT family transporter n=1 Tax=Candidatus Thiothrix putei TaxID=3080811 RepID=A0AA95KN24_9GAMM|nr:MAG: DMT family transporter [Candidatus Thiothrix putei]